MLLVIHTSSKIRFLAARRDFASSSSFLMNEKVRNTPNHTACKISKTIIIAKWKEEELKLLSNTFGILREADRFPLLPRSSALGLYRRLLLAPSQAYHPAKIKGKYKEKQKNKTKGIETKMTLLLDNYWRNNNMQLLRLLHRHHLQEYLRHHDLAVELQ